MFRKTFLAIAIAAVSASAAHGESLRSMLCCNQIPDCICKRCCPSYCKKPLPKVCGPLPPYLTCGPNHYSNSATTRRISFAQ